MPKDIINTDIYNITNTVLDLTKQYINEPQETLAVSLYGSIVAMESNKIQRAIEVAGQMANEALPSKARLEKNIIIHAITNNITNINAFPAKIYALLAINMKMLNSNMINNKFIIDHNNAFYINNYEYHLDYDIEISRVKIIDEQEVYSARYLIDRPNPASDISNPYLNAPAIIKLEDFEDCLSLNVQLLQYNIETIPKKLVTDDSIDNKTITFEFKDQLAFFQIRVTEANETYWVTPVFEGSELDVETGTNYCDYLYLDANTIRIKFVATSVQPGISAQIDIIVYTTKGAECKFQYNDPIITSLSSETYNYKNIDSYMILQSESFNGMDRKTKEELKKMLPKEILSKKCITTTVMLNNYFNTLNTEMVKLKIQPKTDNQIQRVHYAYLVMKDEEMNVIPTNVISLDISQDQFSSIDYDRYIINAGTLFGLNYGNSIARVITEAEIDNYDFVYTSIYTAVITKSPLYASFYILLANETKYLQYEFVNTKTAIQFISNNISWKRRFIDNTNTYILDITLSQSILLNLGLLIENKDENDQIVSVTNNMKVVAIFYKDREAYRYIEAELISYDLSSYIYNWRFTIESADCFDDSTNIKINNMKPCAVKDSEDTQYGYFNSNSKVKIYVLTKLDTELGRDDLDIYIPNVYKGWTVINKYNIIDGINFLINYTEITTTRVSVINNNGNYIYRLKSFPVIGKKYLTTEDRVQYIVKTMNYEKIYIDSALKILENSIGIDFKYYNTYGPSRAFTISTGEYLDRVNISLKYRIQLSSSSDAYVIDSIKRDIKKYIEDFNGNEELHIPNQITSITSSYRNIMNAIVYFEFVSINDYGPGMQHLYSKDKYPVDLVPEFLCIASRVNELGEVEPDITIEIT